MIDFSYQSEDSAIHRLNPAIKIIGLFFISILLLNLKGLRCFFVSSIIIIILILSSNLDMRCVFSPLKKIIWFLIMIFFMNVFFYNNGTCLFKKWLICISEAGIAQGLDILLHTVSVTILSIIFIRTTTSIEIMKGMETIMKPLKIIGLPSKDIALIMSISLQFIPVLLYDIERIRKSQIARGASFSDKSVIKSINSIVIPAFVSVFRRADELALAIEARGYESDYHKIK